MISLIQLCLNSIVQEFERFHYAFSKSNDETLNQHFKFLQRVYSSELISDLSEEGKLKDEYLDFLLNVHLTSFNEEWFIKSRYRKSMKDIICRLPNLRKINLYFICDDEFLEKIVQFCPQVVEIDATCSMITDDGLKYLCKIENGKVPCPNLKNIFIDATIVTDEAVKYLIQNLKSLEKIECSSSLPLVLYSLHKEDLHNLENVPKYNLVHLILREGYLPFYADLFRICLTVCPRLKSLHCAITDEEQLHLFKFTALEELKIKLDSKIDVNNFLKNNGSNLVSLNIHNCIISICVLSSSCPKIQDLDINHSTFSDDADDPCRCVLSSSQVLEYLKFSYCKLSSETKTHILKCCEHGLLKHIEFVSTRVEVAFVKDILLNSLSLETLVSDNCSYTIIEKRELTDFVKTLFTKTDVYLNSVRINDYDYQQPGHEFLEDEPPHPMGGSYPDLIL